MDAGLQIKELAGILGVTEDTVINWEFGRTHPDPKRMERLNRLFDIYG